VKLSLRRKIVGGFGLLLLLILLLGWVTLSLFDSVRSVQRRVYDEAIPGLVVVDEIVRSFTAQSAAVRGYLVDPSPELLEQYELEVREARRREAQARRLFESEIERETLDRLTETGEAFQELVETKVLPLASEGRRSLAFRALGDEGASLISEIERLGLELRTLQDRTVAEGEADLISRSNQALAILLVVIAGALAVGLLVALVLPARLGRNISRLVEAARAIGRGELDHRVEIRSGDEVEELSNRFGEMQSGLKRLQQLALQDRELEIAASIQRNLLQRTVPQVDGIRLVPLLRQANRVGGDWYDVEVSDGLLAVAVGDASGKGIGAALMATVALSVLRAERGLGAAPRRVVARANEALKEATDPDSFTTLIYATVDPLSGEARWLNMGHPPPFVLRGATGSDGSVQGYYAEGPRNKSLGWFEDPGLSEASLVLSPGDRLIFYTDGFIEAKDSNGEIYGDERFAEAVLTLAPLGTGPFCDELVRAVEGYAAGKLDDDLTMIVVEFEGAPQGHDRSEIVAGEESWPSRK
jgi:serine phosphatase RsbU (regulator of sigma subunit)/CHASE3 domain sensor protein